MAVSNTYIDDVYGILRKVLSQATGRTDLGALDGGQLLTIGTQFKNQAQNMGVDPILGSISQMVTTTVFSARKYKRKFQQLKATSMAWGNIVRKLKILDKETDLDNNISYQLPDDDQSVDQYKIDRTETLQLNFAGQKTYEITKTIFDVQYNVCFNSAEEFARFLAMILTYVANKIEKTHEECARTQIRGLIAGRIAEKAKVPASQSVFYLVDEYNAATGAKLTNTSVFAPENFKDFMEWTYAFISSISDRMTEYGTEYQTHLTSGYIDQHTPKADQVAFFQTDILNQCSTRVLTNQFNKQLMQLPNFEKVNYWQSSKPGKGDKINCAHAYYLGADGSKQDGGAVNVSNVFGVLMDREAAGYSPILIRTKQSPYNARGEYRNIFWKFNERFWIDFTEKSVVFMLCTAPA